jgi:hypothetical protein
MNNAEKHRFLHPHQYGSRKGKMCISAVLLKRLSYNHIQQTRMDAIMFIAFATVGVSNRLWSCGRFSINRRDHDDSRWRAMGYGHPHI